MDTELRADEIDRALAIVLAQRRVFELMWTSVGLNWHCTVASLLLAPIMRASFAHKVEVVYGNHDGNKPHVWVEMGLWFFDVALGQFSGQPQWVVASITDQPMYKLVPERRLDEIEEERYRATIESGSFRDDLGDVYSASSAMKELWRR